MLLDFAEVPTSQVLSFAGVGPPYPTVPQVGRRNGLPPEQREGGYWSREEPDEYHGRPRVRGESRYVEDRNDFFGHHRQDRSMGRTRPKTPEVNRPVDWREFEEKGKKSWKKVKKSMGCLMRSRGRWMLTRTC